MEGFFLFCFVLLFLEKRKFYTNEAFIQNCEYLAGLLAVKFIESFGLC